MAYTKQNFEDGQKLKAEHLNKIETGLTDIWSNMQGISNDHREDIAKIQKDVTELESISQDHLDMLNDFNQDISFTLNMSQDHNVAIDKLNTDSAFLMDKSQDHDQMLNDHKIRLNFAEQDIERVDDRVSAIEEKFPGFAVLLTILENTMFTTDQTENIKVLREAWGIEIRTLMSSDGHALQDSNGLYLIPSNITN